MAARRVIVILFRLLAAVSAAGASMAQAQERAVTPGHGDPHAALYGDADALHHKDNASPPFVADHPDAFKKSGSEAGFTVGGAMAHVLSSLQWRVRVGTDVSTRYNPGDTLTVASDDSLTALAGLELLSGLSASHIDRQFSVLTEITDGRLSVLTGTDLVPYVGGGVVVSYRSPDGVKTPGTELTFEENAVLSWQLGAGIAWEVTPSLALALDYRWVSSGAPTLTFDLPGGGVESKSSNQVGLLGLRYNF